MSQQLDDLITEVAEVTSVEASAVALIEKIVAELEAAQDDPIKLAQLVADLKAATEPLATAVAANTPVAPPVEEPTENPG